MIDPNHLLAADRHLRSIDPVLGRLIERHGACGLGGRKRDPFQVLATSIISQQLSTKAADSIQARVEQLVGAKPGHLKPEQLLAVSTEQLRGAGLSNAKARWLQSLAEATRSGELSFKALAKLDDEAAIAVLDALPGVGRWTAEMFLMVALGRPDIFSLGDLGLRRSVDKLYNRGEKLSEPATLAIVAPWGPYRSIASWYLWRLTDDDLLGGGT